MSNLPIRPAKNWKLANPAREQKELSIPDLKVFTFSFVYLYFYFMSE